MRSFVACAALAVATLAAAETPARVEKLLAYKGTWKIDAERFSTRFSKAGKDSNVLRNDCWRSGGFFVCDQFVDGESKDLIVFTYDAKNDSFNSYSMPAGGGEGGNGKLIIKGNVWTYPWDRQDDGKTYHFQVVNVFTAPGTIEYRQEFSEDRVHWTLTAKGTEHKLDEPK